MLFLVNAIFAITLGVKLQRLLKEMTKIKIILAKIGNRRPVSPIIS